MINEINKAMEEQKAAVELPKIYEELCDGQPSDVLTEKASVMASTILYSMNISILITVTALAKLGLIDDN
jgi:hypothetical protein